MLAETLGIDAVLTGSLQRAGETVRMTIQLSSTTSGQALWARTYDGELRTILSLEDKVARALTDRLQIALTPSERARITAPQPEVAPAAYESYVRGSYFLGKVTEADFRRAIGYFQQAINLNRHLLVPMLGSRAVIRS